MRRLLMLLCVTAAVALPPPVRAGVAIHDVTGSWRGFFQGVDDRDPRGASSFAIRTQDGRRFAGRFSVGDTTCMAKGTVSESLQMSATGDCGPTSHLVLQGKVNDTDERSIIPCVFEGRWALTSRTGNQKGDLVLLHAEGGPTEDAQGHWEGSATTQELRARCR